MKKALYAALVSGAMTALPVVAQESLEVASPLDDLNWISGPASVAVTERATLELPDGYVYLGADDTRVLMELMENPGSDNEYYVAPMDDDWFVVFEYDDTGHIEDNEELDPASLLTSIRQGNDQANAERRRRGWQELDILGWQYEPFYETDTQRLAWAILAASGGEQVVNYNTRLLGRTGVISAVLVADPANLDSAVGQLKTTLDGFSYNSGQRYAEYRPGDKLATYGLAALVAGGTAAAVASSGMGKALFKFIGVAVVGAFAAVSAFFRRLFGKRT
jgi:uncharacterized membrane-anchored protein